jgi:hypothetical protein
MPLGHTRTQRARRPGHLGDLPARRGHSLYCGPRCIRPASSRPSREDRRQPHAPRERGWDKGHEPSGPEGPP